MFSCLVSVCAHGYVCFLWQCRRHKPNSVSEMRPFTCKADSIISIISRGSICVWPEFSKPKRANHYVENMIKSPVSSVTIWDICGFGGCITCPSVNSYGETESQRPIIGSIFDSLFISLLQMMIVRVWWFGSLVFYNAAPEGPSFAIQVCPH